MHVYYPYPIAQLASADQHQAMASRRCRWQFLTRLKCRRLHKSYCAISTDVVVMRTARRGKVCKHAKYQFVAGWNASADAATAAARTCVRQTRARASSSAGGRRARRIGSAQRQRACLQHAATSRSVLRGTANVHSLHSLTVTLHWYLNSSLCYSRRSCVRVRAAGLAERLPAAAAPPRPTPPLPPKLLIRCCRFIFIAGRNRHPASRAPPALRTAYSTGPAMQPVRVRVGSRLLRFIACDMCCMIPTCTHVCRKVLLTCHRWSATIFLLSSKREDQEDKHTSFLS